MDEYFAERRIKGMTDIIDDVAPILIDTPPIERESPEPEKQVTMSQSQLDALIKSRQAASLKKAAKAEEELSRLKAITVGSSEDASTVEKLRAEIALEQQRASAAEARAAAQEKAILQGRLGSSINAVDTESVSKLLADRITMRDGKAIVLDESGAEQKNPDGSPTSPEQLYQSWAEAHPWAIRGQVIPGTGERGFQGQRPPAQIPLEQIFGPKSDARLANQIALRNGGRDYARMKIEAKKRGLI
jgi:hypothetical protein